MKKLIILFLVITSVVEVSAQELPFHTPHAYHYNQNYVYTFKPDGTPEYVYAPANAPIWAYTYVYVGGDEFNGNSLDYSKWRNHYWWGGRSMPEKDNSEKQYYTDGDNIEVSNGTLKFTVRNEPVFEKTYDWMADEELLSDEMPNKRWYNYTSGMIQSQKMYKYGIFEARVKVPAGQGFFPAFWLLSYNQHTKHNSSETGLDEIDIFEGRGKATNEYKYGIVAPRDPKKYGQYPNNGWVNINPSMSAEFKTFRLHWQKETIEIACLPNSYQVLAYNYNHPMHVILNLAIASNAEFGPEPNSSTPFPSVMEVDYVRIYKPMFGCGPELNLCSYNYFNWRQGGQTCLLGSEIKVDEGMGCETVVRSSPISEQEQGQTMIDLIAINNIEFFPGFSTEMGVTVDARLLGECPRDKFFTLGKTEITKQLFLDSDTSNSKTKVLEVYPNPVLKREVTIAVEDELIKDIFLLDSRGNLVFSQADIFESEYIINDLHVPSGLYIILIIKDDGSELTHKLIITNE